jgi:DNA-binding NarL/FixJ family response regulator
MRAGVRTLILAESDLQVVAEASNGIEAVELTGKFRPDVVLMDVSLPELSGGDATKQILADVPGTRVLVLSAHEEPAFARLLLGAGASGYVLKRSACDELVGAVRAVAAGGTYVDPNLAAALAPRGERKRGPTRGILAVSLSEREAEVIRLIARGHTSKEMAESLGISPRTLETYKARAMSKLELRTRADLIRYAMRSGWLRDV